jgi:outer membrane protein assembly factor BamB
LIVSEHEVDELPANLAATVLRGVFPKLRPYGGAACLAIGGSVSKLLEGSQLPTHFSGLQIAQDDQWTVVRRMGALPGAADWSHELATAAGVGASADSFVKAPLGLLWFNAEHEWHRKPGSAIVRVTGGRVLVKAEKLHAMDVYTGRQLWEKELPFTHTHVDEMVSASDVIYVANGKTCYTLDATTGEEIGQMKLPHESPGAWRNLRCWNDYLVCTSGRHVVGWNRKTGERLWRFDCNRAALSVCVGGGRVYCAELLNVRRGEKESDAVKTRALDIRTGEVLWEIACGSNVLYSEPLDLLVNASGVHRGVSGQLVRVLPQPASVGEQKPVPGPLFVIGDKLLWGTTASFTVLNLVTGERDGSATSWIRRGCTTIRASEHMVTTRVKANAAYIDLETRQATSLWNIRPACLNNLYPADGVLNVPNVVGGCTCNYTHASQAYVPVVEIQRAAGK